MKKLLIFTILYFVTAVAAFAMPMSTNSQINKNISTVRVTPTVIKAVLPAKVTNPVEPAMPVACTMDAKKCEDGSFVGRVGPSCEFAPCPGEVEKPTICTLEYAPVCAEKFTGIQCIKAPCPSSILKTYGNKCEAKADEAKILYEGECIEDMVGDKDIDQKQKTPIRQTATQYLIAYFTPQTITDNISREEKNSKQNIKQAVFVVESLKKADSEDVRRMIFNSEIKNKFTKPETATLSVSEEKVDQEILRKKDMILKKSKDVFPKFDYFIQKAEMTSDKISSVVDELKQKGLTSAPIDKKVVEMKESVSLAKDYKTEAWMKLNLIILMDDLSNAKENISDTKYYLGESKKAIKNTFRLSKEIIGDLKEILK